MIMGETKEYIKGDKHVHQAGSVMIKFAQYNVPGQKGDWKQQEEKEAEELEKEFADFDEVVDETVESHETKVKVKPDLPPADVFVNRVKAIVTEAAKKNGETIKTNTRAWQGEYVFFVDGQRIAKMMDDLRKNYETKINEFLSITSKYDGVMIVAPFIGKLLQMKELRARDLQFTDLEFAFAPYYNKPASAVKRMSDKLDSAEANMLFGLLQGLLNKYPKTEST
jgi:ribosome-binding factor A